MNGVSTEIGSFDGFAFKHKRCCFVNHSLNSKIHKQAKMSYEVIPNDGWLYVSDNKGPSKVRPEFVLWSSYFNFICIFWPVVGSIQDKT